ncbi:MAG: ester cyclase [Hyphomonadaceae bacterium]|nr:ester cyclase [Hyphomonadaceae bacterium]
MTTRRTLIVATAAAAVSAPALAHARPKGGRTLRVALDYVENFLGRADVAAADRTLDPDVVVVTGLSPQGPIRGLAAYKPIFLEFHQAFPPIDPANPMKIIDAFDTRDRAVVRFHFRARHARDYFGVRATNREILLDETHVMRLAGGKVVENVVSATNLEFEMLMAPALTPLILK